MPADMTALDYLSKYVWVSQQRKQLYKRVFLKYLNRVEQQESELALGSDDSPLVEYKDRTMAWRSLPQALEDVLEFHGTEENVKNTLTYLSYEATGSGEVDFRAWCGIVSFAERLALTNAARSDDDSCDELEKSDFNSMDQIIGQFEVPEKINDIFRIIRITHKIRY